MQTTSKVHSKDPVLFLNLPKDRRFQCLVYKPLLYDHSLGDGTISIALKTTYNVNIFEPKSPSCISSENSRFIYKTTHSLQF